MEAIISIYKYTILKKILKPPYIYMDSSISKLLKKYLESFFPNIEFQNFNNLQLKQQQYRSIIVNALPDDINLRGLLVPNGILYLFSKNYKKDIDTLLLEYQYVKNYPIKNSLSLELQKSFETIELKGDSNNSYEHLIVCSQEKIEDISYSINIPLNSFRNIFSSFYISYKNFNKIVERYNKAIEKIENLDLEKGDLLYKNKILIAKQKEIKKIIKTKFYKINNLEKNIALKNEKIKELLTFSNIAIKNLENKNYYISNNDYELLEKISFLEQEIIKLYLMLGRLHFNSDKKNTINQNYIEKYNLKREFKLETDKLNNKLKKLVNENKVLIGKNNEYVSEISHLKFDINSMIDEKNDLISSIETVENLLSENGKKFEEEIKNLDIIINDLKDENNDLKDENNNLKDENNNLKDENNNLKDENNNLKDENNNLKDENNNLKDENINLKDETDLLKTEYKKLKDKDISKDKLLEIENQYKEHFNNLKNKISEKNDLVDQRDQIIQKLKLQIKQLYEEKDGSERINTQLVAENTRLKSIKNRLDNENKALLENQKNIDEEMKELKKQSDDSYYRMLYENIEKEVTQLKKRNKKLSENIQDYEDEQKEYELKIQELIGYNERVKEQINQLKNRLNLNKE